jgi:hypothetical protein
MDFGSIIRMDFVLPFDLTLGCTVVTPGFTTCEVTRGDTLTALESVWSVMCMNEDIWDSLSSLARSSLSFLTSSALRSSFNSSLACATSCLRIARRLGSCCSGSAVISRSKRGRSCSRTCLSRRETGCIGASGGYRFLHMCFDEKTVTEASSSRQIPSARLAIEARVVGKTEICYQWETTAGADDQGSPWPPRWAGSVLCPRGQLFHGDTH